MSSSHTGASADADLPPLYAVASLPAPSLPQYTQAPGADERVLSSEPSSPLLFAHTRTRRCVATSGALEVDFGTFPLTLAHPAYGRGGVVEGVVRFRKACSYVTEVTVKLEGTVTTTASEHGSVAVPCVNKMPLLSRSATLLSTGASSGGGGADTRCICAGTELAFSLAFPSYIAGQTAALPPSYTAIQPGVCTQVEYHVQVDVARKGVFRRHELCKVPVLYLPQTRPPVQPLTEFPQTLLEELPDRIKGIELQRVWPRTSRLSWQVDQVPSIQLFLPFPHCFASGQPVPLGLIVRCPASPALVQLYTSDITVVLVKRTKQHTRTTRGAAVRDLVLSTATLAGRSDLEGGTESRLWYVLGAGRSGCETSWKVDGVIEVSYIVRVIVQPIQKKCLPTFRKDEVVQLTTDAYDTLGVESIEGGLSEPALGLTALRHY